MKKYLLLRNNQESGPHSFEKISSLRLLPMDLIWVEDESTCWKHPEEIEELKSFVNYDQLLKEASIKNEKVFIALPSNVVQKSRHELNEEYELLPVNQLEPVLETYLVTPFDELKENYRASKETKPVWEKRVFQSSGTTGIAAIFLGVVLGALVIKKLVDGYVSGIPEETAVATPIIDREPVREATENFKNALVTEIVPVYKKTPKTSKPANVKKQLKLSANNYKVGLFGGINGLQLTVFNTSTQIVDKAIVALDYLRPNGDVVQSENILFTAIKPKGSQTIAVPGSDRGVKVKYKILKVFSHSYKADLKQI
jgi:hypothetical protein